MEPDAFDRLARRAARRGRRARRDRRGTGRRRSSPTAAARCHAVRGTAADGGDRARPDPRRQPLQPRRGGGAGRAPTISKRGCASRTTVKPGALMPPFGMLGDDRLRAMTALPPRAAMTSPRRPAWRRPRPRRPRCRRRRRRGCRAPGPCRPAGATGRRSTTPSSALWYIAVTLLFFLFGGVLALLMRLQLAVPEQRLAVGRSLQPDLHRARLGDDVPVRDPDLRGGLDHVPAADARRARAAVSAAVGVRLLGLRDRRHCSCAARSSSTPRPRAAGSCTRR